MSTRIITKTKKLITVKNFIVLIFLSFSIGGFAQAVDNTKCADNYKRNNGNGQFVSEFAVNILPTSEYYLNRVTSGNQGNFTFEWYDGITYPPVVHRTWVTSTSNQTTLNWTFGNNSTGSPFNPPGIPLLDEVKYTFYNNNLPNAGVISIEFIDPIDGEVLCICSYPLSNGANSTGDLMSLAVVPPTNLSYSTASATQNYGSAGSSVEPTIFDGGGDVTYSIGTPVTGVTIDPNTGIISWSETAAAGTHNITIIGNNGISPNTSAVYTLTINSIPVVADIEGDSQLAPGASTSLTNETPDGVWSSSNTSIATVNSSGQVTGVSNGEVVISYSVTNTYGTTTKTHDVLITDEGVGSGSNGGLESESLGTAIAERLFASKTEGKTDKINYKSSEPFVSTDLNRSFLDFENISELLPSEGILGNGFKAYVSSPLDILTFTNAQEVAAVDYLQNGINRAVAFCTKTSGDVYTHTKPVCDRLKGAELLSVDSINYGDFDFLLYHLKQTNGIMEYAVSFSVGKNNGNPVIELQSEWLVFSYLPYETMYNFQLWSSDRNLLHKMIADVMDKLISIAPIKQIGPREMPSVYVTKADRDPENQLNLLLNIRNHTSAKTGTLIISGKPNEQSEIPFIENFDINLKPNADTNVIVPLKDIAESEISLFVNDKREDYIYNNDGIWNIYASESSTVNKFIISNDEIQPDSEEYRLFRNIELDAISSDYITVYKMLRSGGLPLNLSDYQYFSLAASGTERVRIRLIKKSIINFEDQYEIVLPLTELKNKEYAIDLADFRSKTYQETINPNDLVLISFTFETNTANAAIIASLNNMRFTNKIGNSNLTEDQLSIFPNPISTYFNYSFISEQEEPLQLELMDPATGKVQMIKKIEAQEGQNNFKLDLPANFPTGVYIVTVSSKTQYFKSKILILNR